MAGKLSFLHIVNVTKTIIVQKVSRTDSSVEEIKNSRSSGLNHLTNYQQFPRFTTILLDSISVTGKRSLPSTEAEILLFTPVSGKIFISETRETL